MFSNNLTAIFIIIFCLLLRENTQSEYTILDAVFVYFPDTLVKYS